MDHFRVRAEIDLDAVRDNIRHMYARLATDARIYAVVKADGYGHGAVPIARCIEPMDEVGGFAAATYEEARELYDGGIKKPILILGYTFAHTYEDIVRRHFRPTLFTGEMAKELAEAARRVGEAVYCHVKIDTGMGRIGYPVTDAAAEEIAGLFEAYPQLIPEGIFTHFARADETDKAATDAQLAKFQTMVGLLAERGIDFPIRHASNSAAILEYPRAHFNAVRAGIILYGLLPSEEVGAGYGLRPVLSLKSHIVHLKEVHAGDAISYGGTYVATAARRIATVPVGYADGYARGLSNKGDVLIRGQRAPIVGRVCMDQMMVDVTAIDGVRLLDEVTLAGTDGDAHISLEELGQRSGRFNYEFACDLGNRIPRLYYADGELVSVKEYY